MFSPHQVAYFRSFGYFKINQVFSSAEMELINGEIDSVWAELNQQHDASDGEDYWLPEFVEQSSALAHLIDDDRIFKRVEALLKADFVFGGSEGRLTCVDAANWHADRKCYRLDGSEISYRRAKVLMYLEPVRKDTGCLRIIPGSHRLPLHTELSIQQTNDDDLSSLFGIEGRDFPCVALETEPGDVIFLDHCLFHAVYGGRPNRRFLSMKFGAVPTTQEHIELLQFNNHSLLDPPELFVNSDRPRLRRMVKPLAEWN